VSESNNTSAVSGRHVVKQFGSGDHLVTALGGVSVEIEDNEFFTLLGPSGCGKTTLLRLIAGFEMPTEGEIFLFGDEIEDLPPHKRSINTVFQHYALFPHMTVGENVGFGLKMLGRDPADIEKRVLESLTLAKMEKYIHRKPVQLSGGQQQRVALARALAPKPKVLLLDEPLSALDFKLRKEMQVELKRLQNETGITFIFVTHDQEEALAMSDRVAVMRNGLILQVGDPSEIYDRPAKRFVADFIGDINILRAKLVSKQGDRAMVKLEAGFEGEAGLPADAQDLGDEFSVAIRPEQLSFVDDAVEADLSGSIQHISYFGSGFDYQVLMLSGETITLQLQNRGAGQHDYAVGDEVHIAVGANSMQILGD